MVRVVLPDNLQTLSLAAGQPADIFHWRLLLLDLGGCSFQRLDVSCCPAAWHVVMLSSSPQKLTFGYRFNLSLRGVTLTLLQTWTFGLEDVSLSSSLQSWTLGHNLQPVCRCLPPSTLGQGFFQSLGDVALTSSLQTLTFGYDDEIKRAACSPGPLASDST